MKIKVDECVPHSVFELLVAQGYDVHNVHQECLSGAPDAKVWQVTQSECRFLVTTDLDFSDTRIYEPGTHHGILLLRLKNEGQDAIGRLMEWLLSHYRLDSWAEALVVVTDHKVRVKKFGDRKI